MEWVICGGERGDGSDDFVVCGMEVFVALGDSGDVDTEVTEDAIVGEGDESEGSGFPEPGAGDDGGGGCFTRVFGCG
jgi:hypothetical protein